ncbi:F0F1 ATP synthase subunit A [Candidatus Nomurabacteria bacterium]|nr:F0F1 ATP synthase subunit A [Candidatus Nomurabacteria bacterium]
MNFFTEFLQAQRDIPGIEPHILFDVFGIPIATSSFMIFLIIVLFLILGLVVRFTFRVQPTKFQVVFEELYNGIKNLLTEVADGDFKRAEGLLPIIGAMFIYLLVANLIGLIPGISDITINGASAFTTPTADFNTTLGLALGSVVVINLISMYEWGIFAYIGNFIKIKPVIVGFRKSAGEGALALVDLFVGVLDIIGEIAKVISLSIRLFANMYAGQILATILMGAFAYVVPAIWYAMGIFSGGMQAMVFAVLVAAYYMLAIPGSENNESENDALEHILDKVPVVANVAETA